MTQFGRGNLPARFVQKISESNGCWLWTAFKNEDGYGKIFVAGKIKFAHRVSYELLVGPVPLGKELDHLCRNRSCVNPLHLEAVEHAVNVARGNADFKKNLTHCKNGHALNERRKCNICQAAATSRYRERKKHEPSK